MKPKQTLALCVLTLAGWWPAGLGAAEVRPNPAQAILRAAAFGSAAGLGKLLEQGASPAAADESGATPLHFAVADKEKVRLLLDKGADVNAVTRQGRTPLAAAAAIDGNVEVVRMLLDKGAQVNFRAPKDPGFPTPNPHGATALIEAARLANPATLKLLLARGADPALGDPMGTTPLMAAALHGRVENARLLLEAGADVNTANAMQLTALMQAAIRGDTGLVNMLIDRGANPHVRGAGGNTALIWAAYNEHQNPELIRTLLAKGVDVSVKNELGETALDVAKKRNHAAVLDLLAPPKRTVRQAAEQGLVKLLESGPSFVKVSGCMSCHNNFQPLIAAAAARGKSVPVNEELAGRQAKMLGGALRGMQDALMQGLDPIPDLPVTGSSALLALAAVKHPADAATDAMARNVALKQSEDGSWRGWSPRAPIEYGDIQATSLSLRAIEAYAPAGMEKEMKDRAARARAWLAKAQPCSTDERISQLEGLAGAAGVNLEPVRKALLAEQRPDGGWAQLAALESDAYATGRALVALAGAGAPVSGDAFQRGIRFLMRTQLDDGTWRVRTRVFPFQPLKESGFPHDRDQWVSASATAWAVAALAQSLP